MEQDDRRCPSAYLRAMIEDQAPLDPRVARGLTRRLAHSIDDRQQAAALRIGVVDQFERLCVARMFGWWTNSFQADAIAALAELERARRRNGDAR